MAEGAECWGQDEAAEPRAGDDPGCRSGQADGLPRGAPGEAGGAHHAEGADVPVVVQVRQGMALSAILEERGSSNGPPIRRASGMPKWTFN